MTLRAATAGALLGIALALAGCAATGSGIGFIRHEKLPVAFQWKSADSVSGTMTATLPDGTIWSGPFFQITSDTRLTGLSPLWDGWGSEWEAGDWDDWDPGPQFLTHYSGRVVANLASVKGLHMRCRFRLIYPFDGMAGGGRGECQLPDGSRIHAQFPNA